MSRTQFILSTLVVMFTGCTDPEPTLEEIEDVGSLCVLGEGLSSNTTYVENGSVEVHVVLQDCAPCNSTDFMTSCSIEQNGSTLTVSATASWWMHYDSDICTLECTTLVATCTSEPLAAGSYTVEYAGEMTSFEVPSMGSAAQIGNPQHLSVDCGS